MFLALSKSKRKKKPLFLWTQVKNTLYNINLFVFVFIIWTQRLSGYVKNI